MNDPVDETLGTFGLVLNIGAIISTALWLSMIGGSSAGSATAAVGVITIVLFTTSIVCFAADRPADDRVDAGDAVSSGRCPTAP